MDTPASPVAPTAVPLRPRARYAAALLLVLVCGLLTRPASRILPPVLTGAVGDMLWALLVYLLIALLFVRWSRRRVFLAATLFAAAIEFSQLYRAPWIQAVRHTTLGYLVLGSGFDPLDLLFYTLGAAAGYASEKLLTSRP